MAGNLNDPYPEDDDFPEPPRLRALRLTVTGLMVALGVGVLFISGVVGWRLLQAQAPHVPVTAEAVALPAGAQITAVGGDGPTLLITARLPGGDEKLFVFTKSDGRLLSESLITRPDGG